MKPASRRRAGAAAILAASLMAAPIGALAWTPDAEAMRQVARGAAWAEVLPSPGGAALIHAAIDIAAPPRAVWAVMTDCKLAAKLVVTVTVCKVVRGDQAAGWDVREQVTRGNLIVPPIRNVFRSDYQPYTLIRFHRLSGDLRVEEGEWRLQAIDGGAGTQVTYVNKVAANITAPAFLVRAGMKHDTANVMVNLRRESLTAARRGAGV
ncbi:MAG: SRPBCC family protein [Caulobacteraceae bacterium]